ncbi:MAG: thioesterase family protein [Pontixanthobacter sp.]
MSQSNPPAFTHRFRVRYAELDPQGVVFNARYLEYADLAITEYWRAKGIMGQAADPLDFHVAHAAVDFRKPIRAEETVEARAWTTRFGHSSMTTRIELHGVAADDMDDGRRDGHSDGHSDQQSDQHSDQQSDDLRAEIELVNVHVDLASGSAKPLPDRVRRALGGSETGT